MAKGLKSFEKVIIVDSNDRPMSWGGDQLCYCTNSTWQDDHHAVKTYSKSHANRLITRTQLYRKRKNFSVDEYRLMPVA